MFFIVNKIFDKFIDMLLENGIERVEDLKIIKGAEKIIFEFNEKHFSDVSIDSKYFQEYLQKRNCTRINFK